MSISTRRIKNEGLAHGTYGGPNQTDHIGGSYLDEG